MFVQAKDYVDKINLEQRDKTTFKSFLPEIKYKLQHIFVALFLNLEYRKNAGRV